MQLGSNVRVCLKDACGVEVPESVREGHNILTDYGREWLRNLIVWDTLGASDTPVEDRRLTRFVYGRGYQPATRYVTWPAIYYTSYDVTAQGVTTFPNSTTLRMEHTIGTGSGNGITFSEVGLALRKDLGSTENKLAFYKTFEPILKTSSFSLVTVWELKF